MNKAAINVLKKELVVMSTEKKNTKSKHDQTDCEKKKMQIV